jgi:hypothetical protein
VGSFTSGGAPVSGGTENCPYAGQAIMIAGNVSRKINEHSLLEALMMISPYFQKEDERLASAGILG